MAELVQYYGTGRRKIGVARVFLRPGSGEFKVNGKPFDEYFVTESQRIAAQVSRSPDRDRGHLQHDLPASPAVA